MILQDFPVRRENPITGDTFGEAVDNAIESNGFGLVARCRDIVTGDARAAPPSERSPPNPLRPAAAPPRHPRRGSDKSPAP